MIEKYLQIQTELDLAFTDWIDNTELKEKLAVAYKNAGITKTAVASDVQLFYESKPAQKRVEGIQKNGYKLINTTHNGRV